MTSIITGDIVGSRKAMVPNLWMDPLKEYFSTIGNEPDVWQFFRGDSFQIEIKDVGNVLREAIRIKALVKCIKGLDVRMAIGIGEKSYSAARITESNGEAFVNSGELFERIKKKKLAIKSPWDDFDNQINLYIDLALLIMDKWTKSSAEIVKITLDQPESTQNDLAKKMGITQGRISDRQKRAGLDEILKLEQRFRILVMDKIK